MRDVVTVAEAAKMAEIGVEIIRFYEREGLIAAPQRCPSGHWQYLSETIRRQWRISDLPRTRACTR